MAAVLVLPCMTFLWHNIGFPCGMQQRKCGKEFHVSHLCTLQSKYLDCLHGLRKGRAGRQSWLFPFSLGISATHTRNWDSYPKSYDIVIYFGLIFLSLTIQRICISCKVFQRHCRLVVVEVMEDGRSLVSMVLETYQALSVVAFSWTAGVFNSVSFDEMTQLNSHPFKEIHQFPVVTITCPGTCSGNVFKGWLIWAEERLRTLSPTTKEC